MSSDGQTYDVECVVCGGRGGWWIWPEDRNGLIGEAGRVTCGRCGGTGWEPSESVRRVVRGVSS